jgi:hypothetical protein
MQRLLPIEPAKIAGIVRDQHEIPFGGMAQDVPVLPPGLADMSDVLGFVAGLAGHRNEIDAQALIDQKSHSIPIGTSFRRVLRIGG